MDTKPVFLKFKSALPKHDLRSPLFAKLRRGATVSWFRVLILILIDAVSMSAAWKLAVLYGTEINSPWTAADGSKFLPLVLVVSLVIFSIRRLYKAGNNRRDYVGVVEAISFSNIVLLLIAFLYEPNHYVSRSTFLLFWLLSCGFICVGRFGFDIATNFIRSRGKVRHSVFLIYDDEDKDRNVNLIESQNCYTLAGVADSTALDRINREKTFIFLHDLGIEEVFISWNAIRGRLHLCWRFKADGITLRILQTKSEPLLVKPEFLMIGQHPCLTLPTPILIGGEYWVKRCFDFCFSAILLVILSPVLALIAVAIRLDSTGGIFFRQTRIGLHNQEFKVWKFRTMISNAERLQANLELQNEMKDGILFKMKSDPRVTKIGSFLRHYSLDELPQLFNVLCGEMSFVGPRPLPARDVERFKESHFIRQEILPGITGLWQVSGRSNIDNFEDAISLDLTYISNWSLLLDMHIILKTVWVVFSRAGAY